MKISKCYNCGSGENTFYAEENSFILVKCVFCGLLFVENRPDDDEITQANIQGKHGGYKKFDMTGSFDPKKVYQYNDVLKDLYKGDFGCKKKWLDIGCGHGEFIVAVQELFPGNFIVTGTEPNIEKQKLARKRGLNVNYFDMNTHQEKYDVISMLNVYSHLPDPPTFLESLKKNLNPGGELIIQTGDTSGLDAKDHYRPFYLPDHLSFASESIIVGILERLDFEILSIIKYPLLRFDLTSIVKELVKAILPRYKSRIRRGLNMKKYSQTDMFIRSRINY